MKSNLLRKAVLFFGFVAVSVFIFYGFQPTENTNKKRDDTTYLSTKNAEIPQSITGFDAKHISKCGGGSKTSGTKSKCGTGKCGDGKSMANRKISSFMDSDTNGDGKVSLAEFTVHSLKEFANKDQDNDGKLSKDECKMFDSFNADGDKYITKDEFEKGHIAMFKKSDKNNDGFVDEKEAKSLHKSGSKKCGAGKCGNGKCGGGK